MKNLLFAYLNVLFCLSKLLITLGKNSIKPYYIMLSQPSIKVTCAIIINVCMCACM